jgi:hypothetical protein
VPVARDRIIFWVALLILLPTTSLGAIVLSWSPQVPVPALVGHLFAGLCFVLMLPVYLAGGWSTSDIPGATCRKLMQMLKLSVATTGLSAVLLILYAVVVEILFRMLMWQYAATPRVPIWTSGFADLALVGGATVLAWHCSGNREFLTALLWLAVLAAMWAALQIPAFSQDAEGRVFMSRWLNVLALLMAVVAGVFVAGTGLAYRRRRQSAWPASLYVLAQPPADGLGFRYSMGILAAVILLLGCTQLVLPLTGPAGLIGGLAVLALAHRQWNENLADVGIALMTLGVVSLVVVCFPSLPIWWTGPAWAEVFNRVLFGLALMAGVWFWFAAFWRQQLDAGLAWTTTGHLVHTARQVGFFVAAVAVLISFYLAFWPALPYGSVDGGAWRWGWGLAANGLLILVLLMAVRRTMKSTIGWLLVLAVASALMFAIIRTPHGLLGHTWALYWPAVTAVVGAVLVILGSLLARTEDWQALFEPVYLSGVVVMPLSSIGGVLLGDPQLMLSWVPPLTFGCLIILYLLASLLVGPRTFAAVAVLCAAMCFWKLQDATGWTNIAAPYYYAMLIFLSAGLWAWVAHERQPARLLRVIRWAGIALAVASIAAGFAASRWGDGISGFLSGGTEPVLFGGSQNDA